MKAPLLIVPSQNCRGAFTFSFLSLLLLSLLLGQAITQGRVIQRDRGGADLNSFVQKSPLNRYQRGSSSILDEMEIDIVGESKTPLLAELSFDNQPNDGTREQTETPRGYEPAKGGREPIYNTRLESSPSINEQDADQDKHPKDDNELDKFRTNYMQMKKEKSPSDKTEQDKSDRSDSSTQKGYLKSGSVQSIYLILTFILCILIFKAVILCCPCFIFITDKALKDAIYVLFREVVVVLSCILILVALHFYDILKLSALDATGTIYCALLAVSIWTALGFVLTLYAQGEISNWRKMEKITEDYNKLENIKRQYETLYYRLQQNGRQGSVDPLLIQKIQYFVMRLEFIHPIYLPPMTQSFLRKDFDFAQYLAHAYGKTLSSFFNTSWSALLVLLVLISLFQLMVNGHKDSSQAWLYFLMPAFFLVAFFCYFFSFRRIQRKLHPQISLGGELIKPEEINFHNNYHTIDPFTLYDNIPQPEYLEIENSEELMLSFERSNRRFDQDEEESMLSESNRRSYPRPPEVHQKGRSRCCGLFGKDPPFSEVPNRHEQLFFWGRQGKQFAKITLQVFYILSIIYLSTYIVYHAYYAYYGQNEDTSNATVVTLLILTCICPFFMLLVWAFLLPQILTKFTIITNIEMMKDRELIELVVTEQKKERCQRSYRIYQVLKLIRRELVQELQKQIQDKRLRGFTKKQIVEAFQSCGGQRTKQIRGDAVTSLVRLCGADISKQESYILMKRSISQGDRVRYKDFNAAIEQIMNDVKIDAYYLVQNLLTLFFNSKEKVPYEQLLTFFGEFVSYFEQEDLDGFLKEVQYIKRGSDEIEISELASMIRDDVEHYPK